MNEYLRKKYMQMINENEVINILIALTLMWLNLIHMYISVYVGI